MTKSKISKPNEIRYLGFGFYYDASYGQWKAKPHQISVNKLKEKLKKLTNRSWSVSWEHRCTKLRQLIRGWINYYRIGRFKTIYQRLDGWIRFRIRMYLWKKWKTVKNREKQLRKLGVNALQAKMWSNTRKSYARCASTFLQNKVTKELLRRKGLPSMIDQYQLKHISAQI